MAAEYTLNEGNPNVMLCERGIRTFESHPNPEGAMSDGYQSLTFQQFEQTMAKVSSIANAMGVQIGSLPRRAAV